MAIRINYYLNKKRTTTTINPVLARYFCAAWAIKQGKHNDFFVKKKDVSFYDVDEVGYNADDFHRDDDQLRKVLQSFITGANRGKVIKDSSEIDDMICRYIFDCDAYGKHKADVEYAEFVKNRAYGGSGRAL